jgi:hypothetical protein
MEKITIHEVKEISFTINEPFCVINSYSDGDFELFTNVGNDKVMKVYTMNGNSSCRINKIDSWDAQSINMLPNATKAQIEAAQKVIGIFNNHI